MKSFRIGAVSFLNTLPYVHALRYSADAASFSLLLDHPAAIAQLLTSGQLDAGLVPVTVLAGSSKLHQLAPYGIACDGEVLSVLVCSQVPLEDIRTLLLDYRSRTSAQLVQLLARHYWKLNWTFRQTQEGFEPQISGNTAALLIGDQALRMRCRFPYIYDLGLAWKNFTGLPFVFAAWIGDQTLTPSLGNLLERAFSSVADWARQAAADEQARFDGINITDYLLHCIQYRLNDRHQAGLEHFLALLTEEEIILH
ncbi:MAG: menaquinone biosynthesis protein [Chitinophagales bacterium]|nr:menaquinone biosynthesis protein [Chitinophagales bacterium]MDW8392777.1 menaquinone biosynthesis protein [Chitinophagales bacterium]